MSPALIFFVAIVILLPTLLSIVVVISIIKGKTSTPVFAACYASFIISNLIEVALAGGFTWQTAITTTIFAVFGVVSAILIEIRNYRKALQTP